MQDKQFFLSYKYISVIFEIQNYEVPKNQSKLIYPLSWNWREQCITFEPLFLPR